MRNPSPFSGSPRATCDCVSWPWTLLWPMMLLPASMPLLTRFLFSEVTSIGKLSWISPAPSILLLHYCSSVPCLCLFITITSSLIVCPVGLWTLSSQWWGALHPPCPPPQEPLKNKNLVLEGPVHMHISTFHLLRFQKIPSSSLIHTRAEVEVDGRTKKEIQVLLVPITHPKS